MAEQAAASSKGGKGGKLVGGSRASPRTDTCQCCGAADPAMRCSACSSVAYCSRECQQKAWKTGHKQECKKLKLLRKAEARRGFADGSSGVSSSGAEGSLGVKERPEESNSTPPVPKQVLFPPARYLELAAAPPQRKAPLGLQNVGNSCYANSLLQSLLATPTLAAFLASGEHGRGCLKPSASEWCVVCELEQLAQAAYRPGGGGSLNPRSLLRHVKRLGRQFCFGQQEDSHELYLRLMEAVEAVQLLEAGGKDKFNLRSRETTFIHQAFSGYTRTTVECQACGHVSRTYECCTSLTLEVSARVASLEAALQRFAATERLDGENKYKCDACSARVAADKYTRIEVAPHYLQVCLKRFAPGRYGKITSKLSYTERLDLSPYMAPGAADGAAPPLYRLYAVVVHLDVGRSTDYGHYIAYVRNGDAWFCCDDSCVTPVAAAKALGAGAYLLFYERDKPRDIPAAAAAAGESAASAEAAGETVAAAAAVAAAGAGPLLLPEAGEELAHMLRVETAPASLPHLGAEEQQEEEEGSGAAAASSSRGDLSPSSSRDQLEQLQQQREVRQGIEWGTPERMHASASESDLAAAGQRSRPASASCTPRAAGRGSGGSGGLSGRLDQQQQQQQGAAAAAARAEVEALRLEAEPGSPHSTASGNSSGGGDFVPSANPFSMLDEGSEEDEEVAQGSGNNSGSCSSEAAEAEAIEAEEHPAAAASAVGAAAVGAAEAASPEAPPSSSAIRSSRSAMAEAPTAAALQQQTERAGSTQASTQAGGEAAGAATCTPRHRASVTSSAGGQRVLRLSVDLPGVQEQAQVDWRLTVGPSSAAQLQLRAEQFRLELPLPVQVAADVGAVKWSRHKLTVTWPLLS